MRLPRLFNRLSLSDVTIPVTIDSEESMLDLLTYSTDVFWRDVREAEGARLESVCGGNLTVGSNPTLSAGSPGLENLGRVVIPNNSHVVSVATI